MNEQYALDDGWDDELAVPVGPQAKGEGIPSEGWPKTFKPEVIGRLLSYIPEDE